MGAGHRTPAARPGRRDGGGSAGGRHRPGVRRPPVPLRGAPLTRTVRDSAALLDAVSGPEPGARRPVPRPARTPPRPYPAPPVRAAPPMPRPAPPVPGPFLGETDRDPGRLRIASSLRTSGGHPVHPACVTALHDSVGLCADLGHDLVEENLPGLTQEVGTAIGTVYGAAVAWIVAYWTRELGRAPRPEELEPYTRASWERGRRVTGGDYLPAVTTLQSFARTVARFLARYDVWLTLALAQPPLPLGEITSAEEDPWRTARASAPFIAFPLVVANINGAPAMSVPLHRSHRAPAPVGCRGAEIRWTFGAAARFGGAVGRIVDA
ncbi:amidase family protein [Streptomyces sp. NPDC094032]|uniref:amidase family protein n=1 Tax=Streptomyces sp. NPDC094032 TaxID=3155308 RepID=UPI003330A55E